MKSLPLSLQDKALLNARNMADNIKEPSVPMMMRHRPPGSLDLTA
jgi:hypothetical protein